MTHEAYISRCIELAKLSGGAVGSNPNVGAILVYNGRIIGEGYHEVFSGPHAEVNAIASVKEKDKHLIRESTLYVSLEPCNIHRKTPPCSELIIRSGIKNVVVGCEDPNPDIAGSSLDYLEQQGITVTRNICEDASKVLIESFRTNILYNRPFVTLKFAQSSDFYISRKGEQTWLSNKFSKVLSHKLRATNHGILIGNRTAIIDNPSLTTRDYPGPSPLRICIDKENEISNASNLLQDEHPTLLISEIEREEPLALLKEQWVMPIHLPSVLRKLYEEKQIGRLIVEGGSATIKHFVKGDLWDLAYVINCEKKLHDGLRAPQVNGRLRETFDLAGDSIQVISR